MQTISNLLRPQPMSSVPPRRMSSTVATARHMLPIREYLERDLHTQQGEAGFEESMSHLARLNKRHEPELETQMGVEVEMEALATLNERHAHEIENREPEGGFKFPNARSTAYRIILLFLVACLGLGPYFGYDFAGACAPQLRDIGFNTTEIGSLYTVYSAPSTVLVVVGGITVDKLGIFSSFLVFYSVLMVGEAFVVAATYMKESKDTAYALMLVGYVLVSAQESIMVLQSKMIGMTFRSRGLAKALALANSFTRLGTVAALAALPSIADQFGLSNAAWAVFGVCGGCFGLSAVGMWMFYRHLDAENVKEKQAEKEPTNRLHLLSDFKLMPKGILLLMGLAATGYISMQLYSSFSVDILTQQFGYSERISGVFGSLQMLVALIFTPIVAIFIDYFAYRLTISIMASALLIPLYVVIAWAPIVPIPFSVLIGLVYSLACASMYPMVVLMTPNHLLATAFALLYSAQNTSILITAVIMGAVKDATGGYAIPITILIAYAGASLIFGVALLFYDRNYLDSALQLSRDHKQWMPHPHRNLTQLDPEAKAYSFH